jgi:hypothetical protein
MSGKAGKVIAREGEKHRYGNALLWGGKKEFLDESTRIFALGNSAV